jgi:hypothetical protein
MKVVPNNRMVNGLVNRVFDPETGYQLTNEPIELDTLDFHKRLHYRQLLNNGDLVEYQEPVKPEVKPKKQIKEGEIE